MPILYFKSKIQHDVVPQKLFKLKNKKEEKKITWTARQTILHLIVYFPIHICPNLFLKNKNENTFQFSIDYDQFVR